MIENGVGPLSASDYREFYAASPVLKKSGNETGAESGAETVTCGIGAKTTCGADGKIGTGMKPGYPKNESESAAGAESHGGESATAENATVSSSVQKRGKNGIHDGAESGTETLNGAETCP